jgi:hypothetical protein
MALPQANRQWYTYHDSNGVVWNKLGSDDAACAAINGNAAAVAGQPDYPRASRRRQPRKAIYVDPTTFRTHTCVIYTSAAFDAIAGGATLAVPVVGQAGTVTYDLSQKVPDKAPIRASARQLPDHA